MLLFIFVIGGLYGLPFLPRFTPTEAGGVGATGAFLIGVLTGRLDKDKILASLLQATRTAAAVFTVLIGALIFGYFLTVTQTPQKVTELLTGLGLGPYGILALIMVMYLVLGCLMDAMAMIILTVPIIFPVIMHLGFDPIWFGVIIVMTVELGLIHPPVGMNVFVIKSVVKDVSFSTIFRGVLPVRGDRPDPAGDPDRIPDTGAVAAATHGRIGHEMTPQLRPDTSSPSPREIGDVDLGRRHRHRRAPHHPDPRRRGEGRGDQRQGLPFGADFQIIRPNELIELEAKYAFETDDGAMVYVENKGLRFGPVDLLQKLKRGEPVDPKLIYFRTVPRFETGNEKYRWLMENLFIGSAARHADRVVIDVHQVL